MRFRLNPAGFAAGQLALALGACDLQTPVSPRGAPAERQIKTLVYLVNEKPVLLLLRGDHDLNEVKLAEATGSAS